MVVKTAEIPLDIENIARFLIWKETRVYRI